MSAVRIWGATGLGLVALFVALAGWNPATAGGPDLCLFHRATGIACPACGLTRAASALAHGELSESLRWHPLGAVLAAEAALLWLAWGAALRERPRELAQERTRFARLQRLASRCAIASGALLLLVWLVRLATGTLPRMSADPPAPAESVERAAWRSRQRRRWRLALLGVALAFVFDWSRPPSRQVSAGLELAAIRGYQGWISPWLQKGGVRCRFTPSCSHYAAAVVARDGFVAGNVRTLGRLVRCGPWTAAGTVDPP